MRLLQCSGTGGYNLTKPFTNDDTILSYAILPHTWGADSDEVTYDDLANDTGRDKLGYEKICLMSAGQARWPGSLGSIVGS
jgi:hypothetical protein